MRTTDGKIRCRFEEGKIRSSGYFYYDTILRTSNVLTIKLELQLLHIRNINTY